MKVINQEELNILEIVDKIKSGQTIVYPTETCYGLGCDATNQEAVEKVFKIKQRQQDKAMLVVVPSVAMIMLYVEWDAKLAELSQKYWPGPLTVVARVKPDCALAKGVVAEDGTLAFRVTNHPLSAELSEVLGHPLVSTSANITSTQSPYEVASILKMFEKSNVQPDIIIDGGELPHHSPSTIVRIIDNQLEELRQGELVIE